MPVRVGTPGKRQTIHPTTKWQTMKTRLTKGALQVDLDRFYVDVNEQ
jgi:hypothetical protein